MTPCIGLLGCASLIPVCDGESGQSGTLIRWYCLILVTAVVGALAVGTPALQALLALGVLLFLAVLFLLSLLEVVVGFLWQRDAR